MKDKFHVLYTSEGENLKGQPWNIYPRPQLRRDSFFCLNGEWDFYEEEQKKEEERQARIEAKKEAQQARKEGRTTERRRRVFCEET